MGSTYVFNKKLLFSVLLLQLPLICEGATSQTNLMESDLVFVNSAESATTKAQLQSFFSKMTPLDKAKASSWGLTDREWGRYKELMVTTQRDIWTPNIDPITLLGVESRTDTERQHFARLFNQIEMARQKKELKFADAQIRDVQRIAPESNVFKSYLEQREIKRVSYHNQGKLSLGSPQSDNAWSTTTYFAQINLAIECDDKCNSDLKSILGKDRLDLYFSNASNDDSIYAFAKKYDIDSERVKSGQITLNYGSEGLNQNPTDFLTVYEMTDNEPATVVSEW